MLGRRDDAIREGKRACEILSYEKDTWTGGIWIGNLAQIFAPCGDKDAALGQVEKAPRRPAGVTYGELKSDPEWDSLRGDPRFEKIVASLAPKDATSTKRSPITSSLTSMC